MSMMAEEELDIKGELAREICSIPSLFSACTHRPARSPHRPPFIDWYLVLGVEEEAGIDAIRRRYRRLALLLHPDKNSNPKSEAAFKIVSEAYECLSNEAPRRAFNSERRQSFCSECHNSRRRRPKLSDPKPGNASGRPSFGGAQNKLRRALAALKEARKRFQEECRVIESCLRANGAASRGGSPLFDPSLYAVFSSDYPHCRDQLTSENQRPRRFSGGYGGGRRCESPLYDVRAEQFR